MFDAELFCANISKLRRDADMTQSELADKLNITRQAVSRYEKGDSFPDISVLVKIAEITRKISGSSCRKLLHKAPCT